MAKYFIDFSLRANTQGLRENTVEDIPKKMHHIVPPLIY